MSKKITILEVRNIIRKVLNENENADVQSDTIIDERVLREILNGYLTAGIWAEEEMLTDEYNEKAIEGFKIQPGELNTDYIDEDSKIESYLDIKKFIKLAGNQAVMEALDKSDADQLGMDIWFTRNGHGTGFFDHNYENEKQLMDAAKKLKEVGLFWNNENRLEIF